MLKNRIVTKFLPVGARVSGSLCPTVCFHYVNFNNLITLHSIT